jgi:hypothetical protein
MDKLKYELDQKPTPNRDLKNKAQSESEISLTAELKKVKDFQEQHEYQYRPEQELELNPEKIHEFDLESKPLMKNEQSLGYRPEQKLKLEPEPSGLTNDNDLTMTEDECINRLESILTPELIQKFVIAHSAHDDGNDTPPSSAELEESFRSLIAQLGFRGPKIEGFVQRAMTVIDDYDMTDKYDNIDQTTGKKSFEKDEAIDYTSSLAGLELDVDIQDSKEEPDLGTSATLQRNPHLNNPYYINPKKKPTPFD